MRWVLYEFRLLVGLKAAARIKEESNNVVLISPNIPPQVNFVEYPSQSLVVSGKCRNFAAKYAYLIYDSDRKGLQG